jgi:hypothetical protein
VNQPEFEGEDTYIIRVSKLDPDWENEKDRNS